MWHILLSILFILLISLILCGCGNKTKFDIEEYKISASELASRIDSNSSPYANVASWELKFYNSITNVGGKFDAEYAFEHGTEWYCEETGLVWDDIIKEYDDVCKSYMDFIAIDIGDDYAAGQIRDEMSTLYNAYNSIVSTVNNPSSSAFRSCATALQDFSSSLDLLNSYCK